MDKELDIKINCHSSICINKEIYIDPYNIEEFERTAKVIFITHSHYDHFDPKSIKLIADENTIFVSINEVIEKLVELGYKKENLIEITPNSSGKAGEVKFETFPSYNISKKFHPKENGNVGYHIFVDDTKYTIVGDSDVTEELKSIKTDILFLPIGSTYTMNAVEAVMLANIIKPKIVIPVHYNLIVGSKEDEKTFLNTLDKNINYEILL